MRLLAVHINTRYNPLTQEQFRFDYPNVFQLKSAGGHSVDDNNNTRSRDGDLSRAWKVKTPSKKHYMMCFAIAEANALRYWNYVHPNAKMTKHEWRCTIVPELLRSYQRARQERDADGLDSVDDEAGQEQNSNGGFDAVEHELKQFPMKPTGQRVSQCSLSQLSCFHPYIRFSLLPPICWSTVSENLLDQELHEESHNILHLQISTRALRAALWHTHKSWNNAHTTSQAAQYRYASSS